MDGPIQETIEKAESLPPKDRTGLYSVLRDWIKKDFRTELGKLVQSNVQTNIQAHANRDIKLSRLMSGNFARVLNCFVEGQNLKDKGSARLLAEWDATLKADLFNTTDPKSVVNAAGKDKQQTIKEEFWGPISILTLLDLLKTGTPGITDKLNLRQILVTGEADVFNKVDLELRFGDKSPRGKVVRLIQLKTTGQNIFDISEVGEDFIPRQFKGDPGDVKKMVRYGRKMEADSKEPLDVRTFLITIPAWDSWAINNIFGIITDNRDERIERFTENAQKSGLLPKGVK